jgi:hypothetical protein
VDNRGGRGSGANVGIEVMANELGSTEKAQPKDYDTTLARIAGNVAAGLAASVPHDQLAFQSVKLAREIVDEVKRTSKIADDLSTSPS